MGRKRKRRSVGQEEASAKSPRETGQAASKADDEPRPRKGAKGKKGEQRGDGGGGGVVPAIESKAGAPRMSKLQLQMKRRLEGGKFRMINEDLYTCESSKSFTRFQEEPELFEVYHSGYREQVSKWPVNPLDIIISWLKKSRPNATVADFGCGEGRLGLSVSNTVHSFDLRSPAPHITACDMAHVPLSDSSVDVVVFCLSLMGTNIVDFVSEARRVLVAGGTVKVAEVRSRFEGAPGGLEAFMHVMEQLGFDKVSCDRSNTMFVMLEFRKAKRTPEKGVHFTAKACIYKRR